MTIKKSSLDEIRQRFDHDVERFSNLDTGQQTTLDAQYVLDLMTDMAVSLCPNATSILDIGCGAGNYTVKLLSKMPNLHCTLIDLSQPMLDKAEERIRPLTNQSITTLHNDILSTELQHNAYDIILAGAVLHHLRSPEEWHSVFTKFFQSLRKGGCLLVSDLVIHDSATVHHLIWHRYGEYLEKLGGPTYRDKVFAYIEKEDSPTSINFQHRILKQVGFQAFDILHKNLCFASYVAIK